MDREGVFDETAVPVGWFDPTQQDIGWYANDLLDTVTGGGGAAVPVFYYHLAMQGIA